MNLIVTRYQVAAWVSVLLSLVAIAAPGSALIARKTIDLNGYNLATDSYDSADPAHSFLGGYPSNMPALALANGDVVVSSGNLTNSFATGNARIAGSLRVGGAGTNAIGASGSVGDKAWVESDSPGIQPGHLDTYLYLSVADASLPAGGTSWLPVIPQPVVVDGITYKYSFPSNGDYKISALTGGIFVGNSADVRLWITGSVLLAGPTNAIRIAAAGRLQLFVSGDSFSMSGSEVLNDSDWPRAFVYFGLPSNSSINLSGNGPLVGVIHAPSAGVTIGGGTNNSREITGALVAQSIRLDANLNLHLDENLYRLGLLPPVIVTPPLTQRVAAGHSAGFTLRSVGGGPRTYQWRFNGLEIPGATTNQLIKTKVGIGDEGSYTAIVTNVYGAATSAPASLRLVFPPEFVWARNATNAGTGPTPFSKIDDLAVDAAGALVAGGSFSAAEIDFGGGKLTNGSEAANFLCKYDAFGNLLWARNAGTSPTTLSPVRVGDAAGNSWLAAHFTGIARLGGIALTNGGMADLFLARFDPQGSVLWAKQIAAYDPAYWNSFGLAVDTSGNAYLSSRYQGLADFGSLTVSNGSAFLAKFDGGGALVWAREAAEANAIAAATNGELYATGAGFLVKYDEQGLLLWSNVFPYGRAIALDQAQNVVVTGEGLPGIYGPFTVTNSGPTDLVVAKYDSSGAGLWLRQAGSSKQLSGQALDLDRDGNVFLAALSSVKEVEPSITFGRTTLSNVSYLVAKYDANGNALWARALGTPNQAVAKALAATPSGTLFLGGYYTGSLELANQALTQDPASMGSLFLARLEGSEPQARLTLSKNIATVHVGLNGYPGFDYVLEGSGGLGNWSALTTNTAPFEWMDNDDAQLKFYRARLTP